MSDAPRFTSGQRLAALIIASHIVEGCRPSHCHNREQVRTILSAMIVELDLELTDEEEAAIEAGDIDAVLDGVNR